MSHHHDTFRLPLVATRVVLTACRYVVQIVWTGIKAVVLLCYQDLCVITSVELIYSYQQGLCARLVEEHIFIRDNQAALCDCKTL